MVAGAKFTHTQLHISVNYWTTVKMCGDKQMRCVQDLTTNLALGQPWSSALRGKRHHENCEFGVCMQGGIYRLGLRFGLSLMLALGLEDEGSGLGLGLGPGVWVRVRGGGSPG